MSANMFKGRLNRSTYILGNILAFGFAAFVAFSGLISEEESLTLVEMVILAISVLVIFWILGVNIKRGHDVGLPGIATFLLLFLPGVGIALAILPGKKQNNQYGAPHTKMFDFPTLFLTK